MTDIVERLRGHAEIMARDKGKIVRFIDAADCVEAADLIEALRQEVKALHTAGDKLNYYAGHTDDCEDVTGAYAGSCSCGYRAAWQQWRLALGDKP
jgi:hypothetical protein